MINETHESPIGQSVYMTELYDWLELPKAEYSRFATRELEKNLYAECGKEYEPCQMKVKKIGIVGRKERKEFNIHIDFAIKICMVAKSKKANEIKNTLVQMFRKVESADLMTAEEAIFGMKLIKAFEFIENQKKAYEMHRANFTTKISHEAIVSTKCYIVFEQYRNNLMGYDKSLIAKWIESYCKSIYSENLAKKRQREINKLARYKQIAIIDIQKAVETSIIDYLCSQDKETSSIDRCRKVINKLMEAEQPHLKMNTPLWNEIPTEIKSSLAIQ